MSGSPRYHRPALHSHRPALAQPPAPHGHPAMLASSRVSRSRAASSAAGSVTSTAAVVPSAGNVTPVTAASAVVTSHPARYGPGPGAGWRGRGRSRAGAAAAGAGWAADWPVAAAGLCPGAFGFWVTATVTVGVGATAGVAGAPSGCSRTAPERSGRTPRSARAPKPQRRRPCARSTGTGGASPRCGLHRSGQTVHVDSPEWVPIGRAAGDGRVKDHFARTAACRKLIGNRVKASLRTPQRPARKSGTRAPGSSAHPSGTLSA
jgi:hypothetical protein